MCLCRGDKALYIVEPAGPQLGQMHVLRTVSLESINFGINIPLAWVCGRWLPGIPGSNPAGAMDVSPLCVCCVLSGRGLCGWLIARPEESYRVGCV
jgi:hypothetical protein